MKMGDGGNDHPCFIGEEMKGSDSSRAVRTELGTAFWEPGPCSPTHSRISLCSSLPGV